MHICAAFTLASAALRSPSPAGSTTRYMIQLRFVTPPVRRAPPALPSPVPPGVDDDLGCGVDEAAAVTAVGSAARKKVFLQVSWESASALCSQHEAWWSGRGGEA